MVTNLTSSLDISNRIVSASISSTAWIGAAFGTAFGAVASAGVGTGSLAGSGTLSFATGSRGRLGTLPYLTAGGRSHYNDVVPQFGSMHVARRDALEWSPFANWKIGVTICALTDTA